MYLWNKFIKYKTNILRKFNECIDFFYRLRLVDLYADEHYLISLILSWCLEPAECVDHHIFTNAVLPKPTCDLSNEFKVKGKIIYNLEMKYIL